jgi:DNA-binding XRE family transcriptional regulator
VALAWAGEATFGSRDDGRVSEADAPYLAARKAEPWARANGRAASKSRRYFVRNALRYMWVLTLASGQYERAVLMAQVSEFARRLRVALDGRAFPYWYSPELHPGGHGWHVNFFVAPRLVSMRRTQRGLSGAELARRARISKTTLSNLEAGVGNPTVATLDALAIALRVPMTDLLATGVGSLPVLVPGTGGGPAGVTRELLRRVSGGHSLEMWRLRIPAKETSNGLPHATGTIEHLFVACGHVTAGPADNPVLLNRGDFFAFVGDVPHLYRTDEEPADLVVMFAAPAPF